MPYYPRSAHIEAAKHLRLTVTRYIADRATLADVEAAMVELRAAAPVAGERGHRKRTAACPPGFFCVHEVRCPGCAR